MAEIVIPDANQPRRRTRVYDPTVGMEELISAITASLTPPGALAPSLSSTDPGEGWKVCDGQALAKAEFPRLYAVLGGAYGETATTFSLPDLRGRSVMGTGGTPALTLAAYGGAAAVTLTVDQIPAHNHALTDPGHIHGFTGAPHSHTITDPGHTHTITDPGHAHASDQAGGAADAAAGADEATAESGSTAAATTGITVDSATTGVTVDAETAGGTISSATTGITIADTGGGQPFDIIPPVVAVNWIIKT